MIIRLDDDLKIQSMIKLLEGLFKREPNPELRNKYNEAIQALRRLREDNIFNNAPF